MKRKMGVAAKLRAHPQDPDVRFEAFKALHHALEEVNYDVRHIHALLDAILEVKAWTKVYTGHPGDAGEFASFRAAALRMVMTGSINNESDLEKAIERTGDTDLTRKWHEAMGEGPGQPAKETKGKESTTAVVNYVRPDMYSRAGGAVRIHGMAKAGNQQAAKLYDQVVAGEKTVTGALVDLGLKKKYVGVAIEPGAVIRFILRHFDPEQVAEITEGIIQQKGQGLTDAPPKPKVRKPTRKERK
jgi:hypothetical protein